MFNLRALLDLAQNETYTVDCKNYGLESAGNMAALIEEANARKQEAVRKTAGEALLTMMLRLEDAKKNRVATIRAFRKQEKAELKWLRDADAAFDAGKESGNFFPLLKLLGMDGYFSAEMKELAGE